MTHIDFFYNFFQKWSFSQIRVQFFKALSFRTKKGCQTWMSHQTAITTKSIRNALVYSSNGLLQLFYSRPSAGTLAPPICPCFTPRSPASRTTSTSTSTSTRSTTTRHLADKTRTRTTPRTATKKTSWRNEDQVQRVFLSKVHTFTFGFWRAFSALSNSFLWMTKKWKWVG